MLKGHNIDGSVAELITQTISSIKLQRISPWVRVIWTDSMKLLAFRVLTGWVRLAVIEEGGELSHLSQ